MKNKIKTKKEAWKKYIINKTVQNRREYLVKRNEAKEAVKQAKKDTWEEFGRKIEDNYIENQKQFWNIVKRLKGNRAPKVRNIRDETGILQTSTEEILKAWKDYYATKFKDEETEIRREEEQQPHEGNDNQDNGEEITEEEIKEALKNTKNGKAAGEDNIAPEMLKKGGPIITKWMKEIVQQAWNTEQIPKDWEKNIIVPIHKKGDTTNRDNYRAICLSSVALKIYTRIVEKRLRNETENKLEEEQTAFRPGRQTQDYIYTVRAIIEKLLEKKKDIYLLFLDLKGAFDQVPHKYICKALEELEVSPKLRRIIRNMNNNVTGKIRLNNQISEEFQMERGIKQGDSLSPLLFVIYMDYINKKCKTEIRNTHIGYHNLTPVMTQDLIYADDILLMARNKNRLQENINIWKKHLEESGMTINIDKTKVMHVTKQDNEEEEVDIQIDGKHIQTVQTYEYLGVLINKDGRIDQEIKHRISKGNRTYYQINNTLIGKKEISIKAKMHLYKTIYTPTLLYSSETWTMTDKQKSKITTAEMRYLRRVVGKTRRDRVRNRSIRDDLELAPLVEDIKIKQLQWYGHLVRMSNERYPKKIFEMRCDGRRDRGRPRRKWEDNIYESAREKGQTLTQIRTLARDRQSFKQWLKSPTP